MGFNDDRPRRFSTSSRHPFVARNATFPKASSYRRSAGETGALFAPSPPAPVSPGSAGDEPPPAPPQGQGLLLCVLPPAGDRGGLVAEGDRADEDFDLGPAPSSGLATTPGTSPWVRTLPWVAAESSRRSPADFLLPQPPFDASGATRAARGGAALSVVSGASARAGSSCRQRTFISRSVGTAESPEPPTPSMRGVPALRLPQARASCLFGGWRFQFDSFPPASLVGPGGL